MKEETFQTLFYWVIILVIGSVALLIPLPILLDDSFCEEKGFNYALNDRSAQEGYIICCLEIYKDHIKQDPYCEAFPE